MEKFLSWFALKSVPGVGNLLFSRLIRRFRSPGEVFMASYEELLSVRGITRHLARAIQRHNVGDEVKREIELAERKGYRIITLSAPEYPPLLLQIPDPPPFLYVYGDMGNSAKSIAVVGSRTATAYGISAATSLAAELAERDITVISGMAKGVDTAAHDGAVMAKMGKGKTIAVLGSGLERIYPRENHRLFHKISENGAVISEFHLKAEPEAHNFPIRNRIIAGISLGTVVVEAGRKSGALITAEFALEYDREVFAIPGNIHSFKSVGSHELIKNGAKLVTNVQDILDELPHIIREHIASKNISQSKILDKLPPLSSEELLVFKELGPYPVHIDDLAQKTSVEPGKLSGILLQLELRGIVRQEPGMLFSIEVKMF